MAVLGAFCLGLAAAAWGLRLRGRLAHLGWAGPAAALTAANAGPYEDALLHFTTDSFSDTTDGINGVIASGNPLAATVIGALQEGRLLFSAADKRVFIREKSDQLIDAA